jgi:ppGpp synthetase/RelA/SpoT-type nucleotidyltranferase
MNIDMAVREFSEKHYLYKRHTNKIKNLLEEILIGQRVQCSLEYRTKEVIRFREKIARPGKAYVDPLNEVNDLSGVRIILRRKSDIQKVVQMLRKEFSIDETNSIYKGEELDVDQFGYTSIHLVVTDHPSRSSLTEWQIFSELKAEIQVRTILQHAWATISHSFDYKIKTDIPRRLRRRLFRLSALFELADEELDEITGQIELNLEKYRQQVMVNTEEVELNVDSLKAFIETSLEVAYWNEYLRKNTGQKVESWGDLSRDVRIAAFCGIKTINEIRNIIMKAKGWGEKFLSDYFHNFFNTRNVTPDKVTTVINGTVTMLIIATYVDQFTEQIMEKDFGWGKSSYMLEAARKSKK